MKKLIAITGTDGVGKSTLIDSLLKELPEVREVSIWDALDGNLFTSKLEIDNYLCSLQPNSRLLFLAHALKEAVERADQSTADTLLLNGYYYKYFASELALGADKNLVKELISFFPKANLVIKLEVPTDIAFSRKKRLSQYECGISMPSESSFMSFQKKVASQWQFFDQGNWKSIAAVESPEMVMDSALQFIQGVQL